MANQRIVIKAGYLKKHTQASGASSFLKRTNRRWFVFIIFGGLPSLEYYEDLQSAAVDPPINSFDLRGCLNVIPSPADPLTFTFTLHDRVISLTAENDADMEDWVRVLNRNLPQFASRDKPDNIYGDLDMENEYVLGEDEVKEMSKAGINGTDNDDNGLCFKPLGSEVAREIQKLEQRLALAGGSSATEQFRDELSAVATNNQDSVESFSDLQELEQLDDNTYCLLDKKYRDLEDWDALTDLRAKRNRSATGVFKPNPDPPPYVHSLEPIPIAGFFENKGLSVDPANDGKYYVNPLGPKGPILSAYAAVIEKLKRQIMHPGGIAVLCKPRDLLNHVAIVSFENRCWIAGWDRRATRLHSCLHVGDQVMALDGMRIDSLDKLTRLLQGSVDKVQLRLRRMPLGKVFCVRRANGTSLGLRMNGHKAEIIHVIPDGIAAAHGLTYRTIGFLDDCQLVTWSITEINSRPLTLWPEPKELDVRLNAHGQEMSLVVHPTDFVRCLKRQLKKMKDYKKFVIQ